MLPSLPKPCPRCKVSFTNPAPKQIVPLSLIQVKLISSFETWDTGNEADMPSMEVTPPCPGCIVETGGSVAELQDHPW